MIAGDDLVDRLYLDVERQILDLFALQTPVASDLRLLTALLHINLHLERIADMAVNIAKIARLADGLPQQLPAMDDPVDRLNHRMVELILADQHCIQWGIRMQVVSREIERIGDHAVDIAEQVAYLITGRFQEFTDASHPNPPGGPTT